MKDQRTGQSKRGEKKERKPRKVGPMMPDRPDRKSNMSMLTRTIFLAVVFGVALFLPLFKELYTIQITQHEEYQAKAIEQQTMDNAVAAQRGDITDANGKVLAMSATVYDIILSPNDFRKVQQSWDDKYGDAPEKAKYARPEVDTVVKGLAEILDMEEEKLYKSMEKQTYYEVLAKRVEKPVADEVLTFITEHHLSNSILRVPTSKRYYTYNSLAAQLIGWVNPNNDNKGAYGMEALYEEDLAGKTGRVVTAKNGSGTEMKYSFQDYYDATDGNDLNLTIDTTIQYYCERILEKGIEMYDVQDGGFVIAMDPKTGAIKAWANSPTYDLNTPWTVSDPVLTEYLESVQADPSSNEEAYLKALGQMQNKQWRNKAINDTYEPGSTFKIMVLAAALEEGVITQNSTYYCPGYAKVADRTISCSEKKGHGQQTLAQAVANSCNPAFISIGQALGAEKFYDYLEDFGFLEPTGVDMQGESQTDPVSAGLLWSRSKFTSANGITNLATASFGQGFQVTPIQLITAASSVINGGHLMQPYVMRSITDQDGNVLEENEPTEVRQVVSESTSELCRSILESVVDGGTGKRAYIPGYRVGGKTGSSETLESRQGIDHTIVSFLGFAPADDPQIVVLVMYDNPKPAYHRSNLTAKNYYISGGNMAAPMAGELLENILEYMGVERHYTETEKAMVDVAVPTLTGQTLAAAKQAAEGAGFTVRTVGDGDTVTDQIPLGGSSIPTGSEIVLYLGQEKPTDQVKVPSLRGKTMTEAQALLEKAGLYLKVGGSSRYISSIATVASQSITSGTGVDRGTVVECTFSDNTMTE